jgi:hypothetical protein
MEKGGQTFIYICHHCGAPTFFNNDHTQTPGPRFGNAVQDIPDQSVKLIYEEARGATSAGSYTAAVLCLRKLLMHVAVDKGAKQKKSFQFYVDFLSKNHFVPTDAKGWVDHIRDKGNEANHKIVISPKEDAEELIEFSEMLLKFIYQFPAAAKRRTAKPTTPPQT